MGKMPLRNAQQMDIRFEANLTTVGNSGKKSNGSGGRDKTNRPISLADSISLFRR